MDNEIILANIYGPPENDAQFFLDLTDNLRNLKDTDIVIAKNWDIVLDSGLDYYNYR